MFPNNPSEAGCRKIDIAFGGLTGLFLERMRHVNAILHRRNIDDPKSAAFIVHPDFPNTGADRRHRLPIVRGKTALNSLQLISSLAGASAGKSWSASRALPTIAIRFMAYIDTDINRRQSKPRQPADGAALAA
jgi:hypothetical protein